MLNRRVIPRVDLQDGVVEGEYRFEGHLDPSDPVTHALLYQSLGADELLLWEHGDPSTGWVSRLDLISELVAAVHIPIIIGGGINSAAAAKAILSAGADRVCLEEAAVERPALISEAAEIAGRARVMVAVDVKRRMGAWNIFYDYGRRPARKDALRFAEEAASMGAGSILITAIKKETGDRAGFDLSLAYTLGQELPIPALIGGDGRTPTHFAEAFECGIAGIVVGAALREGSVDLSHIKAQMAERELNPRPLEPEDALAALIVTPAPDAAARRARRSAAARPAKGDEPSKAPAGALKGDEPSKAASRAVPAEPAGPKAAPGSGEVAPPTAAPATPLKAPTAGGPPAPTADERPAPVTAEVIAELASNDTMDEALDDLWDDTVTGVHKMIPEDS